MIIIITQSIGRLNPDNLDGGQCYLCLEFLKTSDQFVQAVHFKLVNLYSGSLRPQPTFVESFRHVPSVFGAPYSLKSVMSRIVPLHLGLGDILVFMHELISGMCPVPIDLFGSCSPVVLLGMGFSRV